MTNSESPILDVQPAESVLAGYRVLVVDDEALVRWSVQQVLQKASYQLSTANTGEEAILHLTSKQYDIIITDMRLPGEDGFAVAAKAKKINPACHVIMMTAFGDTASKERAKALGIEHFVDKPVDLAELVWLVHRLMTK